MTTPEPNAGERLYLAIRDWMASLYDDDPCVVPRFIAIAEGDDGTCRWLDFAAYSADGHPLASWESLGLLDHVTSAIRHGEQPSNHRIDGDDENGEEQHEPLP